MLLARDSVEGESLALRTELLRGAGLEASCCSASQASQLEPGLRLPQNGAALLLPTDAQLVRKPPALLPRASMHVSTDVPVIPLSQNTLNCSTAWSSSQRCTASAEWQACCAIVSRGLQSIRFAL